MGRIDLNKNLKLDEFSSYINNYLFKSLEEKDLIEELLKIGDIYIFGGIIRDFLFKNNSFLEQIKHRDIDLVVKNFEKANYDIFSKYIIKKSLFGGFKLNINNNIYDIWGYDKTWAFREHPTCFENVEEQLPNTSFFNITAIVYSLKQKKFELNRNFLNALEDKVLDIVFEPNPLPSLCIVKAYEYLNLYKLKPTEKLINYINNEFNIVKNDLENIQIKHFGNVRYSNQEIENFYKSIIL